MADDIIVIRHLGALSWLREQGIDAPVLEHVRHPKQIGGKNVYGVLPLWLAAHARSYTCIDIPYIPLNLRGVELTKEQMYLYGARLRRYIVKEERI